MDRPLLHLPQAFKRPTKGLVKAMRLGNQSTSRLVGTCAALAGRAECDDSQYPSTGHDLWHQTMRAGFRTVSRLCAKFGESGFTFDIALDRAMTVGMVSTKSLKIHNITNFSLFQRRELTVLTVFTERRFMCCVDRNINKFVLQIQVTASLFVNLLSKSENGNRVAIAVISMRFLAHEIRTACSRDSEHKISDIDILDSA
jgi:hypothetical protein